MTACLARTSAGCLARRSLSVSLPQSRRAKQRRGSAPFSQRTKQQRCKACATWRTPSDVAREEKRPRGTNGANQDAGWGPHGRDVLERGPTSLITFSSLERRSS
jgi:hypothetical protein